MGIASQEDNVFWVYDDYNNDIAMYDFAEDHGPGNSEHDDGRVLRYQGMGLNAINTTIVCHLELDKAKKWLYFVDGGNQGLSDWILLLVYWEEHLVGDLTKL
jgi:hypothetical protein